MTTRAEHSVYKDGRSVALTLGLHRGDLSWRDLDREGARSAVRALGGLSRDLLRPLEFGMTRHAMEEMDGFAVVSRQHPDHWNWYLRAPDTPSFAHPALVDAVMVEAETVDEASMLEMAERALDDPSGLSAGEWAEWEEMYVHDTMAHVPRPLGAADHLVVDDHDNRNLDVHIPLVRTDDGAVWVHRAHQVTWPPLSVRIVNDAAGVDFESADADAYIELRIQVNWSLWWEEAAPGRAVFDRAIDRLRRQGWTRMP